MTASKEEVDSILKAQEDVLFKNPNLVKLSVIEDPHRGWIIEAGVVSVDEELQKRALGDTGGLSQETSFVPSQLDLATPSNVKLSVEVDLLQVDKISTQARYGDKISNFAVLSSYGTLGGLQDVKNGFAYMYTNWHVVLNDAGEARIGDPIFLGGGAMPPADTDFLGYVSWTLLDDNFDAALIVSRRAIDLYRCLSISQRSDAAAIIKPIVGKQAYKCGATSGWTNGKVRSDNSTIKVGGYPEGERLFKKQIETEAMSQAGDSGSILFQVDPTRETGPGQTIYRACGLLFAGDSKFTYHNNLEDLKSKIPDSLFTPPLGLTND
ncbi:hypothetical protein [Vulcanococcus limneticus]|uniref:hypothetical protein n=1 Tax=Vulcanococcus limneticus TaxID=2170428 RepID=UPI00398BF97D